VKKKPAKEQENWVPISTFKIGKRVITRKGHHVKIVEKNERYTIVSYNGKKIECPHWMLVKEYQK